MNRSNITNFRTNRGKILEFQHNSNSTGSKKKKKSVTNLGESPTKQNIVLSNKSSNNIIRKNSVTPSKIPRLVRSSKTANELTIKTDNAARRNLSTSLKHADVPVNETCDSQNSTYRPSLKNLLGSTTSLLSEELDDCLINDISCSTKSTADSIEIQDNFTDNTNLRSSSSSLKKLSSKEHNLEKDHSSPKLKASLNSKKYLFIPLSQKSSNKSTSTKRNKYCNCKSVKQLETRYKIKLDRLEMLRKGLEKQQKNIIDTCNSITSIRNEYLANFGKELPMQNLNLENILNTTNSAPSPDSPERSKIDRKTIEEIENTVQRMPQVLFNFCKEIYTKTNDMLQVVVEYKGETNRGTILQRIQEYKADFKNLTERMEKSIQNEITAMKDLLNNLHSVTTNHEPSDTELVKKQLIKNFEDREEKLKDALNEIQQDKHEIQKQVEDIEEKDNEILLLKQKLRELTVALQHANELITHYKKMENENKMELVNKETDQVKQYRTNIEKLNITLREVKGQLHAAESVYNQKVGEMEIVLDEYKEKLLILSHEFEQQELRVKHLQDVTNTKEELYEQKILELTSAWKSAVEKYEEMKHLNEQLEQKYVYAKAEKLTTELKLNEVREEAKSEKSLEEETLQKQMHIVKSSLRIAEERIDTYESEKSELMETLQALYNEQKRLQNQITDKEKIITNLGIQNKKLQKAVELCEEELLKKSSLYERLHEQVELMKSEVIEKNQLRVKLADRYDTQVEGAIDHSDAIRGSCDQNISSLLKDENFALIMNNLINTVNENKTLLVDENKSLKSHMKFMYEQLQLLHFDSEKKDAELGKLHNLLLYKDKMLRERKGKIEALERDNKCLYERKHRLQDKIRNLEKKCTIALQGAAREKQNEFLSHAINLSNYDSAYQDSRELYNLYNEEPSTTKLVRSVSTPKCSIIFKRENKINIVVSKFFENIKKEIDKIFTGILNELSESENFFEY